MARQTKNEGDDAARREDADEVPHSATPDDAAADGPDADVADVASGKTNPWRLPPRQPLRAFAVISIYLLCVAGFAGASFALFRPSLALLLVVAAACGLSVGVAVLAPLPRPEPPTPSLPVQMRTGPKGER